MNILAKIVESKKGEIEQLYEQHDLAALRMQFPENASTTPRFYQRLAESRATGQPFFITEFKRKSPSEGWINQHANLPAQVLAYAQAGAGAISVLTDEPFFGGSYDDLRLAAQTLANFKLSASKAQTPLLLQKDFVLDPIQIYLARLHGADLILLIAAILEPDRLDFLRKTAESLGMGVLVEVHDSGELHKINHLDFPVLGVNNRDLRTFRTALNRVNVVGVKAKPRLLIAESGIRDYRDLQMVRCADGFLIGTGLMREPSWSHSPLAQTEPFAGWFQAQGRRLFKACGVRTPEVLAALTQSAETTPSRPSVDIWNPDFLGFNFSPLSKRRASVETCEALTRAQISGAVAVFYKNSEDEVRATLEKYPFQTVQLYADDVTPEFVRSLRQRVFLALPVRETADLQRLEAFAADVDLFILDGAIPGSGQRIGAAIPEDFPYPFLLAGGLHEGNLDAILAYKNCIGVDIASGIETDGAVDMARVQAVGVQLGSLTRLR